MKLSELDPTIDPRKPLRLAGVVTAARSSRSHSQPAGESARVARVSAADLPTGDAVDLADVDRAIKLVARQAQLIGRPHLSWQQSVLRLHGRPRLTDLRARSARLVSLFTGASTGVLTLLWQQESEQLKTQLNADLVSHWHQLRMLRSAPDEAGGLAEIRAELAKVRTSWRRLEGFDLLDRAFNSPQVLALSPGAATALAARRPVPAIKLERAFQARSGWGSGLVWLPHRRILLAWTVVGGEIHLFEIGAAELTGWVRSLQTDSPIPLDWNQTVIPANGRISGEESWTGLASELTRLLLLGQSPAPASPAPRLRAVQAPSPTGARTQSSAPITRFVITAAEGRTGVDPFDLATGDVPATTEWVAAKFRNTWSAEQGRYLRIWVDAHPQDVRRAPNERVLITLMPA